MPCTPADEQPSSCRATAAAAASSATRTSTTPCAPASSTGPTVVGATRPRPPPSIIAGPPMPRLAPSVAMMTSQQPSSAALPAKQRPATMPISGTCPDSAASARKVLQSSPATPSQSTSPGRPPPPSAHSTSGQRWRAASVQQPVALGVVEDALRAGQHGVVVGHHRDRERPVDGAGAGDQPVGRRRPPQSSTLRRLDCAATAKAPYSVKLPASSRSAMFSRAMRRPAAWRRAHRVGPGVVERQRAAVEHRLQRRRAASPDRARAPVPRRRAAARRQRRRRHSKSTSAAPSSTISPTAQASATTRPSAAPAAALPSSWLPARAASARRALAVPERPRCR